MRPSHFIFYFLFGIFIFFSCSKEQEETLGSTTDTKIPFLAEYNDSVEAWEINKKTKSNSYSFTINAQSAFGFGSNTIITVINGKVVSREYEGYMITEDGQREIIKTWIENENELGSHEEGAEPITLDEIYTDCKTNILTANEEDNYIVFLAENGDLLSVCSYFPKNCQDDCSIGYRISDIQLID